MKNIISKNSEISDSKYSFAIEKTKEKLIKQNISVDEDYYLSIDKNLLSKAKIKDRINSYKIINTLINLFVKTIIILDVETDEIVVE